MSRLHFWPMAALLLAGGSAQGAGPADPEAGIREMLSIPQVGEPRMAPDGSAVAFTEETPDWTGNRYVTEIHIARRGRPEEQFTRSAPGSSWAPRWSSNSRWIAYLADDENGPQIHIAPALGGESKKLTAIPGGVISFEWSPDGHSIALAAPEPTDPAIDSRARKYGKFSILRESAPAANLWILDVGQAQSYGPAGLGDAGSLRRLTGGANFSVVVFSVHELRNNFTFSPDGRTIAFTYAVSLNIMDAIRADVGIVNVGTGIIHRIVQTSDYWEESPVFSPDGRHLLYSRTDMKDFLHDSQLLTIPIEGGEPTILQPRVSNSNRVTGEALVLGWTPSGIDVFALDGVKQYIIRIDPASGKARELAVDPQSITQADFSSDGRELAIVGSNGSGAPETYRLSANRPARITRLTSASAPMSLWPRHKVETIRWNASDGVAVEGVLYTPASVNTPAPLIVVLHGGPREVATPTRLHDELFPVEQWLRRGAVVLFPNYRGSTGYGEHFRRLTTHNIGDAERLDIESGIDDLAARGLIDPGRVGVAGHSWGGYLSAFMATATHRFKAASVAAGITDNTVNYVLSNAGAGKGGYLDSTPWEDPRLWTSTSAIAYVAGAHTPTLIQHGESDAVVPTANALILDRGLLDQGVPVRTVIYSDTGHNHFRPQERLAANLENWQWFERYLWNEDVPLPWTR